MKVFVATEALGEAGDFSYTVPGELVHFPPMFCDCPECGCDRAMAGFTSKRATTCFVVRELDLDVATYTGLLFDSLREGGWVEAASKSDREWVAQWAAEHVRMASGLPVETPLRFHLGGITERRADKTVS
jgi:hypothetical protein